jgi:hypothetical protein
MSYARPYELQLCKCPDGWRPVLGRSATSDGRLVKPGGSKVTARQDKLWSLPLPTPSLCPPRLALRCFPRASPGTPLRAGKQKTAPKDRFNTLISLRKSGAGEGIRTLDPNLGKVVLYP